MREALASRGLRWGLVGWFEFKLREHKAKVFEFDSGDGAKAKQGYILDRLEMLAINTYVYKNLKEGMG